MVETVLIMPNHPIKAERIEGDSFVILPPEATR